MRICILTQYFYPEIGAPQARLFELAEHLDSKGHELIILTAMPNYPTGKIFHGYKGFYKKEMNNNLLIHRAYIYPSKSVKFIPRLLNYFSFVFSSLFIGLYKLPKLDLIITESPPLFLGISGYIISKFKKSKFIFNVSDLWPESAVNLNIVKDGFFLKLAYKLEEFFYKKSWLITGQSFEIIKNINMRFPCLKTYRLSNGVNINRYSSKFKSDILSLWSNEKKFTLVYAGLHGIAQGLDQIVEVAKNIKTSQNDLQIILIGDGNEKEKLKNMASNLDNITFVKPQKKEKMPEIWASADIGFISLKQYIPGAVPSKLYEVMSSEIPVLFVGEGEAADIVNKYNCGIVCKPGKIKDIENAINSLLRDSKLRKKLGSNGVKAVNKNYNRKNILNDFEMYLEDNYVNN